MSLDKDKVWEYIKETVIEQLGYKKDDITSASSLTDDLGADSLDLVEIVMAIEEKYDIEISDKNAGKLKTVGQLVKYIVNHGNDTELRCEF